MVATVRRSGADCIGRASGGVESERRRGGCRIRAGRGGGTPAACHPVSVTGTQRECNALRRRRFATEHDLAATRRSRELGARHLGTVASERDRRARQRSSNRRESRGSTPVGTGAAGNQLFRVARSRQRDRAAHGCGRRIRARAAHHEKSVRRRYRATHRRAAGADSARDDTREPHRDGRAACIARARDRGADRQGAGRAQRAGRTLERQRPGRAAVCVIGAAAAPPRHCLGRAPGRGGECADRHPACGLFPELRDLRRSMAAKAARCRACSPHRTTCGRSACRRRRRCSTPVRSRPESKARRRPATRRSRTIAKPC